MHILRLRLSNFRKFANLEVEFAPGLNVVRGPNEAGKTTLQQAIALALLDRPTGKKAEKEHKAWGAERMYKLEIDCQMTDGREVQVVKDYESTAHEVRSAEGADSSRQALEEFAQEALGTQSIKVFESTACVDQDAMWNLEAGRVEISQQLQAILAGGGDVSLDQAISKLERRIGDLEKGWRTYAPVSPGPIGALLQRIHQLDEDLARARNEVSRLEEARERLGEIRTRLGELQGELGPKTRALQVHQERTAIRKHLAELGQAERELEERLTRLQGAEQQRQEALGAIAGFTSLQELGEDDRGAMRELHQNLLLAEGKEKGRADDVARLELRQAQAKPAQPRRKVTALILTGLGLTLGVLGILLLLTGNQPWMDYLGGAGACTGASLLLGGMGWLVFTLLGKPEDLQSRVEEARRLQEDAGREAARLSAELGEKIQALGCETWEQLEERLAQFDSLNRQASEATARMEGLLREGETIDSVEAQRREVSRTRRDAEEKVADFRSIPDLDLVAYEQLNGEVAKLQGEQLSHEAERLELQGIIKGGTSGLEDVLRLQEEKAALEQELERLQSWHGAYALALQVMREARTGAMRTARDELAPRMAAYLERLTIGRYSQVQVDESLEPVLVHPSKETGPIETDEMSQGTLDQIYLAARLSLCDILFGEARPPLLMDDPFVKFDPERRSAALELCRELSSDRQILLFTCHDGYDQYASSVIDLPAPD